MKVFNPVKSKTALMWASIQGHTDVVNVLIENGADMVMKDRSGTNCLFMGDSDQPEVLDECCFYVIELL